MTVKSYKGTTYIKKHISDFVNFNYLNMNNKTNKFSQDTGMIVAKGLYEMIALGAIFYAIFTLSFQWFLIATVMRLIQYIFNHKK